MASENDTKDSERTYEEVRNTDNRHQYRYRRSLRQRDKNWNSINRSDRQHAFGNKNVKMSVPKIVFHVHYEESNNPNVVGIGLSTDQLYCRH